MADTPRLGAAASSQELGKEQGPTSSRLQLLGNPYFKDNPRILLVKCIPYKLLEEVQ